MCFRSIDGLMLIVTSSDCYCSIITFEPNELGDPLDVSVMFPPTKDSNKTDLSSRPSKEDPTRNFSSSSHKKSGTVTSPSLATQHERVVSPDSKPRRIRPTMISGGKLESAITVTSSPDKQTDSKSSEVQPDKLEALSTKAVAPLAHETISTTTTKAPRRVNFITLSSFKKASSSVQAPSVQDRTDSKLKNNEEIADAMNTE